MFQPEQPGRYVALAWATAFFPSILLAWIVSQVAPQLDTPEFPGSPWLVFFAVVIFSPLVETLMMGAFIDLLRRAVSPLPAVLASAGAAALLHSLQAAAWGLIIWWPFLIFSIAFVTWRDKLGFWRAALLVAGIHALQNLPPAMVIVAGV